MKAAVTLLTTQQSDERESTISLPADLQSPGDSFAWSLLRVWQERALVVKAGLIAAAIALIIAFLIPPEYESGIRIMPPDQKSGTGSALALLASASEDKMGALASQLLGGGKTNGALFIGVLNGRTVQDRIIDRFNLMSVYRVKLRRDARERLADNTDIQEDRKSGIISVTVRDHSRDRAVEMARAYIEELDRLTAQVSTSSAHREREFLENRLVVVKKELDTAAGDLSKFSVKNSTLDITEQGKATIAAAAELEGELIAAQSQLASMKAIYTDGNVRVQALKDRISELRRQLVKVQGPAENETADAPVPGDVIVPIRKLPSLGVQYLDYYRRVKIDEAVYEILTKQFELAKVEEAKEIPTVKVLDDANLPETKSSPHRLLLTLCGGLLGCFGCVLYLFAYQRWQSWDIAHPAKSALLSIREDLRNDFRRYRTRLAHPRR